jgi:hypothetical protein
MSDEWTTVSDTSETWDKSEPIQGVYKRQKTGIGQNESNQYVLETKDGEVAIWGSAVIDSKFEQIPVGSEVRIKFEGKKSGKSGNSYNDYTIAFRGGETQTQVDEENNKSGVEEFFSN